MRLRQQRLYEPTASPLQAAGSAAQVDPETGWPRGCVFKIAFDPKEGNPYSNKVVVMDEAHHQTVPTDAVESSCRHFGNTERRESKTKSRYCQHQY